MSLLNVAWFILKSHVDFHHHHHVLHCAVHVSFLNVVIFPAANHHSVGVSCTFFLNTLVKCDSNISRFTHSHLLILFFIEKLLNYYFFPFSFHFHFIMFWYFIFLVLETNKKKRCFSEKFFVQNKNEETTEKVRTFTHFFEKHVHTWPRHSFFNGGGGRKKYQIIMSDVFYYIYREQAQWILREEFNKKKTILWYAAQLTVRKK